MCIGETRPEQVPLRTPPSPQAGGGGRLGPGPCSSDVAPLGPPYSRDAFSSLGFFQPHTVTSFFKGGDAKLLVILCVPRQKHVAEMLQSLGFGVRARQAEWGHPAPRKPQ